MRFRRGARRPAAESAPAPRPPEAGAPEPPAAQHPDSLVYELLANVALRDLTVIERILSTISDVERGEQDPERLSLYYALDHDVTRLRRSAENALVLAGAQAPMGRTEPMSLLDVARAAASESADYTRVAVGQLPPVAVGPAVADDLAHTLAELMDNALSVSPTRAAVNVTGTRASGGVLVAVEDEGIGIAPDRLPDLNIRLTGPLVLDTASTRQMGLYVVAHLARRHGIYVQLQSRKHLGSTAVAFLPDRLLLEQSGIAAPPATAPPQQPAPPPAPPAPTGRSPLAQRPPRGYQHGSTGQVGPVRRTGQAVDTAAASGQVPRPRAQQPDYDDATAPQPQPPTGRHAQRRQSVAPGPQNPYMQRNDPYAQSAPAPAPGAQQQPQQQPQRGGGPGQRHAYAPPPAPAPPRPGTPTPMPPRAAAPHAGSAPPPVAPATVDRWAPSAQERAEPTDFTDQGLPRRTRPSTPRAFPGGAPREAARPADPDSVLADLEAFASGTAAAAAQGGPQRVSLTGAPPRMQLPPPAPPAGSAPPLLTDPAQEEF